MHGNVDSGRLIVGERPKQQKLMFQVAGPNLLDQRHLGLLGLGLLGLRLELRLEHIHALRRRKILNILNILNILHRLERLHGQRQKIRKTRKTRCAPHTLLCLLALVLALVTIDGSQKWIDLAWRWIPDHISNQITQLVWNMLRLLLLLLLLLLLDVLAEKLLSLLLKLLLLLELKLGHLGRQTKLLKQL